MRLFKPAITVEDWSYRGKARTQKEMEKWAVFYHKGRLVWVKGERRMHKYESDNCVLCGKSLYQWTDDAFAFSDFMSEEVHDHEAVLPFNLCADCAIGLYAHVTLGIK